MKPQLPFRRRSSASSQFGATMIEVLVSFVIFAFGVLGIAGLQTKSLAMSQASLMRSQASALTDDIMDRMRADRGGAISGEWNTDPVRTSSTYSASGTFPIREMHAWKAELETLLPGGQAYIRVNSVSGQATVRITWDDSRGAENRIEFETTTRL